MHANRVIQKMIEKGIIDEISYKKQNFTKFIPDFYEMMNKLINLFNALENKILIASKDSLGCRIIQKLIECFPEFIIEKLILSPIFDNT